MGAAYGGHRCHFAFFQFYLIKLVIDGIILVAHEKCRGSCLVSFQELGDFPRAVCKLFNKVSTDIIKIKVVESVAAAFPDEPGWI